MMLDPALTEDDFPSVEPLAVHGRKEYMEGGANTPQLYSSIV